MEFKKITISPTKAKDMLNGSDNFRIISKARVAELVRVIRDDEWQENNAETVKVTQSGDVIDGQHRLNAVIESGIAVKMVVAYGVDEDSLLSIDRGRPRTVAQYLAHEKIPNAAAVGAIARLCCGYEAGQWGRTSFTHAATADHLIRNYVQDNLERILVATRLCRTQRVVPASTLGAIFCIGGRPQDLSKSELCPYMAEKLRTGTDLSNDDPVYWLRQRFINESPNRKTSQTMRRWIVTLAWNRLVNGDPTTSGAQLRIRTTGPAKSKPPTVIEIEEI